MRPSCTALLAALALPAITTAQSDLDPGTVQARITSAKKRMSAHQDLPIAEWQAADRELTHARRDRARFFDGHGVPLESHTVGGRAPHIVTIVDYIRGFPKALPVSESDVIVRGTVKSARAELSADRTNVYSEFTVRLERTFKQPQGPALNPGSTITVLRDGGAVRFPFGVMVVRRADRTMPLPGSDYVLFLERHSPADDAFMIVTGYCLDGGTVTPLDINPQSVAWEDSPAVELLAGLTE